MRRACFGNRLTSQLAWLALTVTGSSCTLWLDVGRSQCASDDDCVGSGLGTECRNQVCTGNLDTTCEGEHCADDSVGSAGAQLGEMCGEDRCSKTTQCFADSCLAPDVVDSLTCDPAPEDDTKRERISVTLHVREYNDRRPPTNLRVTACRNTDAKCETPEFEFEDLDGLGEAILSLPRHFEGFLDVRSDDLVGALWYSSEPMLHDQDKLLLVPTRDTYELLSSIAGYTPNPEQGIVVLEAQDCNGQALGGVCFTDSKGTGEPYVIVNNLPNKEQEETVRNDEQNMAWGGFINAEPGFSLFAAYLGKNGPLLGQLNVRVQAETLTYVDLVRPQGEPGAE